MRVFLDTNVIVAALATRGLCADVLREAFAHHDLVASEDQFGEIERVLLGKLGVPAEIVAEVIHLLRESSILSEPSGTADLPIKDINDRALVSAAIHGRADLFVTGDQELLALGKFGRTDLVSPREFWERVRGQAAR
jgi:putative PIN family toxin of toxin-antitoxin system